MGMRLESEFRRMGPDAAKAVREFKTSLLTPELVTATFQTIWQVRGESVGI